MLSARAVCGDARFDEIIKIVMSVVARIFIPTNTNPNVLSNEWRRWAKELRDNGESHVTQIGKEVHEWMLKHYGAKTQQEIDEAFCSSLINRELTNDQAKHYLRVIGTLDGNPYSDYAKAEIQAEHVFRRVLRNSLVRKGKLENGGRITNGKIRIIPDCLLAILYFLKQTLTTLSKPKHGKRDVVSR